MVRKPGALPKKQTDSIFNAFTALFNRSVVFGSCITGTKRITPEIVRFLQTESVTLGWSCHREDERRLPIQLIKSDRYGVGGQRKSWNDCISRDFLANNRLLPHNYTLNDNTNNSIQTQTGIMAKSAFIE